MTESDVLRIINCHCKEQKLKFFAHVYRGTKGFILDGFAMTQAYTGMKTIGYEVKVNRSDFLQDKKWPNYLPVCNTFYFVSPPGIIKKEDLPEGIGLYHCTESGLVNIKRAKRKDFDKEAVFEVLQYIALARGLSENSKIKSAIAAMNRVNRNLQKAEQEIRNLKSSNRELYNELLSIRRNKPPEAVLSN